MFHKYSEAQQTKSFGVIINADRHESSLQHETTENCDGGKAMSKKLTKGGYRFNSNREVIPD